MLKVQQPEALRQPRQHHSWKPGDIYCLLRDSAIRISARRTELEYWSASTFLFRVGGWRVMYSHHICTTNQWTASHSHHKFSFFHSIATRHRPYGINLIFPQALVSKWNLYMPLHVGGFTTNETERGKKKRYFTGCLALFLGFFACVRKDTEKTWSAIVDSLVVNPRHSRSAGDKSKRIKGGEKKAVAVFASPAVY